VPALVECEDLGLYVVKLRGAGQGPKALIAELVAGELARAIGLTVPEIVLVELDERMAGSEPDPELAKPLGDSAGLNLGIDYLPGSITFDPLVGPSVDALTASRIVLFDALVLNVDRTPRNPNILAWHGRPWLIDHGAALYFHHGWRPSDRLDTSSDRFEEARPGRVHVTQREAEQLEPGAVVEHQVPAEGAVDRGGELQDDAQVVGELGVVELEPRSEVGLLEAEQRHPPLACVPVREVGQEQVAAPATVEGLHVVGLELMQRSGREMVQELQK
jgi:hypothetical protein